MADNENLSSQTQVIAKAAGENRAIGLRKGDEDLLWAYADINQGRSRWDKVYPYKLALWKRDDAGWQPDALTLPPFVFPIAPENLTISTPFAINTTVTLGGIVEEHNGAPLRTISISGTTGVLPLKGTIAGSAANLITTSIFAGVTSGVNQIKSALGTGLAKNNTLADEDANSSSGYMQFKLLQRFLEKYITIKKTAEGRNTVLALEMWKDQEIYFVSPVNFDLRRSATNPLEYQYSLTFKGWKRVTGSTFDAGAISGHVPVARDPNGLAWAMNNLEAGKKLLEGARNTLTGFRADINAVLFTPIREVVLSLKSALGVTLVATDLPESIISDMQGPIAASRELENAAKALGISLNGLVNPVGDAVHAFNAAATAGVQGELAKRPGPSGRKPPLSSSPADKISENPNAHYDFYSQVQPGILELSPATQRKIAEEKRRVENFKREDFESKRDSVAATLEDFQDAVGLGGATYSRVLGRTVKPVRRQANEQDYDIIFALNAVILEMNRLVVSSDINRNEISSIDYIAGLASRSGIAFQVPRSKFLVPLPYGHTLEQISKMYLNTPDRWHEIAALNGLLAPYIDEVGFILPLLTNGNGNTISVADSSNLFVNQPVWISSTTINKNKRRITKIEVLSPGLVAVTLDGDSDLSQYLVGANAQIQAFLPNTTNSQQSIFIPSEEEVEEDDFRLKSIPGVDTFDPLLRVGGVDLLLTQSGDLVITPDGDTRLAVGLTNIVQKVRLAIDTVRGSLLHHPNYGFPSFVGESTASLDANEILKICREMFAEDPTFTGVESATVIKTGTTIKISISVGVRGTQQVIPVTVEIAQ